MGRSRSGLTSKIHAVVDANGLPVRLGLTAGEVHDNRLCSVLLTGLRPRAMLLQIEHSVGQTYRRNAKDPICFSPFLYRARNLIERFFNKIKYAL
jgi:transposase